MPSIPGPNTILGKSISFGVVVVFRLYSERITVVNDRRKLVVPEPILAVELPTLDVEPAFVV